jgi:hypothetical protein
MVFSIFQAYPPEQEALTRFGLHWHDELNGCADLCCRATPSPRSSGGADVSNQGIWNVADIDARPAIADQARLRPGTNARVAGKRLARACRSRSGCCSSS